MKRIAVLAALTLALVCQLGAEPTYTKVSATSTVTNTTLPANTRTVVIINDGANEVYWRLFTNGETPADATTSSAELKSGESIALIFQPGSTYEQQGAYYKTLSLICAAAETATVRVISK